MHGEETTTIGRRSYAKIWRALAAASIGVVGVVGTASMAGAVEYPDCGSGVGGLQVTNPSDPSDPGDPGDPAEGVSVGVAGKTQTRGQLPFTGGDVTALAALGGGAVIVGGVLLARSRRQRALSVDSV